MSVYSATFVRADGASDELLERCCEYLTAKAAGRRIDELHAFAHWVRLDGVLASEHVREISREFQSEVVEIYVSDEKALVFYFGHYRNGTLVRVLAKEDHEFDDEQPWTTVEGEAQAWENGVFGAEIRLGATKPFQADGPKLRALVNALDLPWDELPFGHEKRHGSPIRTLSLRTEPKPGGRWWQRLLG